MKLPRIQRIAFVIALTTLLPSTISAQNVRRVEKDELTNIGKCEGGCRRNEHCAEGLSCEIKGDNGELPEQCEGKVGGYKRFCYPRGADKSWQGPPQAKKSQEVEKPPPKNEETPPQPPHGGNHVASQSANRERPSSDVQEIIHIGTTQNYVSGSEVFEARIPVPRGTKEGDLLILVLHRSDDFLPFGINGNHNSGWIRAGECFKERNSKDCATFMDCQKCNSARTGYLVNTKNVFCREFGKGRQFGKNTEGSGRDLAQSIFYKEARPQDIGRVITINLSPIMFSSHPGWMFMSSFRGADTVDPIRDWAGTGNDGSTHSIFPSVYGESGDLLLLSQGFDSGAPGVDKTSFLPPKHFENYVSMFDCNGRKPCDESGYLFGRVIGENGPTGERTTQGDGAAEKSDSLVSLTIKPKGGTNSKGRGASEWLGNKGENCPAPMNRPKT